jgi:hypothetical protein
MTARSFTSVVTVRSTRRTADAARRAGLELQTAEANGSVAALLVQRFVLVGDETVVQISSRPPPPCRRLTRGDWPATDTPASTTCKPYPDDRKLRATGGGLAAAIAPAVRQPHRVGLLEQIVPTFRDSAGS